MRKLMALLIVAALVWPTTVPVKGQTLFKNLMQKKYDLRSVSCFVCHEKVERGTENPKQFRNELGKLFDKEFEGQEITKRLEEIEKLKRDDPKRVAVEEEIGQEFLKVLEKIEGKEYPEGGTYKEAFTEAKIDGLRGK